MARRNEPDGGLDRAPRPERQVAFRLGLSAESRAAAYLMAKGYRILAKRFRTPYGEIDIIARRRNLLAFVEVKARATLDDAAFAVTPRQQGASSMPRRFGWRRIPNMRISSCVLTPC